MATSLASLMSRFRAGDHEAGLAAARHPSVTEAALGELSYSDYAETRRAVALHAKASVEMLERLASDADTGVAAAVAAHPALPPATAEALAKRAIAESIMPKSKSRAMLLEMMVALCSSDVPSAASLEKMIGNATSSQVFRLLASQASRPEVLEILARHPKATVRRELLANPALPPHLLSELALDENPRVEASAIRELEDRGEKAPSRMAPLELPKLSPADYEQDRNILWGNQADSIFAFMAKRAAAALSNQADGLILDLACDTGMLAESLAKSFPAAKVRGFDISANYLDAAKARCSQLGNVALTEANLAERIPVGDGEADFIAACDILHCLPNADAFIAEIRRCLREGGRFAGAFRCLEGEEDDCAIYADLATGRGYTLLPFDGICELLATSGFVIEFMSPKFEAIPGITSAEAAKLHDPVWLALREACLGAGGNPDKVSHGLVLVAGRRQTI